MLFAVVPAARGSQGDVNAMAFRSAETDVASGLGVVDYARNGQQLCGNRWGPTPSLRRLCCA